MLLSTAFVSFFCIVLIFLIAFMILNGKVIATQNTPGQVPCGGTGTTMLDFDNTLASGTHARKNTGDSKGRMLLTEVQVWGKSFYHLSAVPSISRVPTTSHTSTLSLNPISAPISIGDGMYLRSTTPPCLNNKSTSLLLSK